MPDQAQFFNMRIVYSVPGMDRVEVKKDLVYRTVSERSLKMDVYSPAHSDNPSPVIFLIHGGPVSPDSNLKDAQPLVSLAQLLAASGFSAVVFNHRLLSPSHFRESAGDLAEVVRIVRERADEFHLDKNRVAFWASSAGGPLLSPWLLQRPSYLRCVAAYSVILDLDVPFPPIATPPEDQRREFSAIRYIGEGVRKVPPIFIAKTENDHPWVNQSIARFVAEALSQNIAFQLLARPNGHHGFEVMDDDVWSKEILERTISFYKTHL